ncbi:MAG: esterase-like activity of phytase family protein [Hyphomicrobiales bacterium]
MFRTAILALGSVLLSVASLPAPAQTLPWSVSGGTATEVKNDPIDQFIVGSDQTNFGALRFMGGVVLSGKTEFGGYSGLIVTQDGMGLLAVSDVGQWFSAEIKRENGRIVGLHNTIVGPIRDAKGAVLNKGRKWYADAEGLAWFKGRVIISFERQKGKVRSADMAKYGFLAPASILAESAPLNSIRGNRGIEAIAVPPDGSAFEGSLIAIGERILSGGNHSGWVLSGNKSRRFKIRRRGDFDITDADFLPNGDLLILERRFSLTLGSAVRIRRISAADFTPEGLATGMTLDGLDLMTADLTHQIDNMEGMAVRVDPDGTPIILLISDDNMNFFQRTLLLEFALRPEEFGVIPPPRPAAANPPRG